MTRRLLSAAVAVAITAPLPVAAQDQPVARATLDDRCLQVMRDFGSEFRSAVKDWTVDCYQNGYVASAEFIATVVQDHPEKLRDIANIVRSWTDRTCTFPVVAWNGAADDIDAWLAGDMTLKEAKSGSYSSATCAKPVPPFTTQCSHSAYGSVCTSSGGGYSSSTTSCFRSKYYSRCTTR